MNSSSWAADSQTNEDQNQLNNNLKIAKLENFCQSLLMCHKQQLKVLRNGRSFLVSFVKIMREHENTRKSRMDRCCD